MPKYYCDYCDVFLTHDSTSVRKAHNSGRNHLTNVRDYYASLGHDKTQDFIDNITKAIERSGGGRPMMGGPAGFGAPPPRQFGGNAFGPHHPNFQGGPPRPPMGMNMGGPPQGFNTGGPLPQFIPQGTPNGMGGPHPSGPGFPQQQQVFQQQSFQPPQGFQQQPSNQFGGQMGPTSGMPPQQPSNMSPPAPGVGMQMNPARAAALGLR